MAEDNSVCGALQCQEWGYLQREQLFEHWREHSYSIGYSLDECQHTGGAREHNQHTPGLDSKAHAGGTRPPEGSPWVLLLQVVLCRALRT